MHRDGRGTRPARREKREYRAYLSAEQRSRDGMHRPSNASVFMSVTTKVDPAAVLGEDFQAPIHDIHDFVPFTFDASAHWIHLMWQPAGANDLDSSGDILVPPDQLPFEIKSDMLI
jgi:hypothetical protein